MVFSGLVIAWRFATWPTNRSPLLVKPTTDGVVRPPSSLGMTLGSPPSITATTEFVVPKSIPIIFAIHFAPARTALLRVLDLASHLSLLLSSYLMPQLTKRFKVGSFVQETRQGRLTSTRSRGNRTGAPRSPGVRGPKTPGRSPNDRFF